MARRVVPSDVTERELAEAFSASPAFAADIVQQCASFRALLEAGGAPPQPVRLPWPLMLPVFCC